MKSAAPLQVLVLMPFFSFAPFNIRIATQLNVLVNVS
jgi:hypothetical protein